MEYYAGGGGGGGGGGSLGAAGTFWRGLDGNVWVAGSNGTNNAGTWDDNSQNYWTEQGYNLEADPISGIGMSDYNPNPTYSKFDSSGNNITGSGTSRPSYSQQDLDYLNNQEGTYNRMLQSLRGAESTGLSRLDTAEASARDSATTQNDRRVRDFNIQRSDSQLGKQQAVDRVNTNARTLADSLRRRLGLASGSSSSAYQLAAPNAVARQASQQRNNVMTNFGQNERDLDLAVKDNETDFAGILQGIINDRKAKEQEFRTGIATQEQGIQNSLSEIASERARLTGGNALSAMRPYQDRYFQLQDAIDGYQTGFNPTFTPRAGTTKTPSLRDYTVDRQAINANRSSGQSTYSPYSQYLLNRDDEEELAVR